MAQELINMRHYQPNPHLPGEHIVTFRHPEQLDTQQLDSVFEYLQNNHSDKRLTIKIKDAHHLTSIPNMERDGLNIVKLFIYDCHHLDQIDDSITEIPLEDIILQGLPRLEHIPQQIKDIHTLINADIEDTGLPEHVVDEILAAVFDRQMHGVPDNVPDDIVGGIYRSRKHRSRKHRSRKHRSRKHRSRKHRSRKHRSRKHRSRKQRRTRRTK